MNLDILQALDEARLDYAGLRSFLGVLDQASGDILGAAVQFIGANVGWKTGWSSTRFLSETTITNDGPRWSPPEVHPMAPRPEPPKPPPPWTARQDFEGGSVVVEIGPRSTTSATVKLDLGKLNLTGTIEDNGSSWWWDEDWCQYESNYFNIDSVKTLDRFAAGVRIAFEIARKRWAEKEAA